MAKTIDKSKRHLEIRSGREVRVYAVDGCGPYPIHGARKDEDGWRSIVRAPEDLEEMPETHTAWINLYPANNLFTTKEAADRGTAMRRVGCIQITYTDGEGLNGQ